MSGGSLDYVYINVEDAAHYIDGQCNNTLYRAFAKHLFKVAEALHKIEWVLSGDSSEGEDIEAIKAVITEEAHLKQVVEEAENIAKELESLIKAAKGE